MSAFHFLKLLGLLLVVSKEPASDTTRALNAKCRDLLSCRRLVNSFNNSTITAQLYNDLDKNIDYGCIFTTGCLDECNRCPLCVTGKEQLVDILSGSHRAADSECSVLINCATDCIPRSRTASSRSATAFDNTCAFHCFDSCPKCSAFVTRIFNQICVAGEFRSKVQNWTGHCYEMFREIVAQKYADEFRAVGRQPSIGNRQSS
ncbi:hypothetical protein M3Y99_01852100 [Aphelenchoides fujianensis]|nr:hypothetical protein M3Y99_01852100 [Aphelenchoides fujianensis]